MYKPVTIKDIAQALHLSTSTVSRALRDGYEISTKTKKTVLDYAEKVNYQSNPIALSLKQKRSYSIGIVVPELANSFFSQAIAGMESIAYQHNYHPIITQTYDSHEREQSNISHLAQRSVDGLIISMSSGTSDYGFLKNLHENGLPMVFFDRTLEEIETYKVVSDNFSGAYEATRALIRAGKSRIALLTNAPQLSISQQRLSGYRQALKDFKMPFNEGLVRDCRHGMNDGAAVESAVAELLAQSPRPDAIFVTSDRISIWCIRALSKFDISSDQLKVVGFSNSDVVDLIRPAISYVRQKAFEMGQLSAEMLLKLIESKKPITEFETKVLDTELFWKDQND